MTAVRTVGVVGGGRFRFGRHSFQGAFFFDFFGFFLFFGFVLFPCFLFLRFPPFPCFPLFFPLLPFLGALASFLPGFPFGFLALGVVTGASVFVPPPHAPIAAATATLNGTRKARLERICSNSGATPVPYAYVEVLSS